MAEKYWSTIAQITGLQYYPKQGPYPKSDGAVMGVRNGYILAIGSGKQGNQSCVKITVRFPAVADTNIVRMALGNSSQLASALDTDSVKDKHLKAATISKDYIVWLLKYSFGKPKAEKVSALANALTDALKGTVVDYQGKCEECRSVPTPQLILMNNIPSFYCTSCQFKMQEKMNSAARAYEQMESNLGLGLMYGVGAAFVGALAWGGLAFALNRIFLWGGVIIGGFVAWALIKGMGRINLLGQISIFVLTVASVIGGDFLFYTFSVMREQHVAFGMGVLSLVASAFWQVEMKEGILSILVAVAGAAYTVYAKARKPKFFATFTPLAPENRAMAAGVGTLK